VNASIRYPAANTGFTLAELLVVTLILGMVLAIIGACLAGGIRAWDTARTLNKANVEAAVGLRIMEKDFVNSFRFYRIGFVGETKKVSFPGLVGDDDPKQIGMIEYAFDRSSRVLFRTEFSYSDDTLRAHDPERIIRGLRDMALEYNSRNSWEGTTNFPVKVTIRLSLAENSRVDEFARTVVLPVPNG